MKKLLVLLLIATLASLGCASNPTLKAVGGVVADAGFEFLKNTLATELTKRCPNCPPATFAIGGKALDAAFNAAKSAALAPASREAATPPELAAMREFLIAPTPDGAGMTESEADEYLELVATVAKPAAQDSALSTPRPWHEAAYVRADSRLAGIWSDARWFASGALWLLSGR